MAIEVELKYRVGDAAALSEQIGELGASRWHECRQTDTYLAHPQRDFAETDEALRVREVDAQVVITYKGPKLDAHTKTRREIEVPLGDGADLGACALEMLEALGFRRVAQVRKTRRHASLDWQDCQVEIALDLVAEVGSFVELEIVTDEAGLDAARRSLLELAARLQLAQPERRSYLELLLAQRAQAG